MGVDFRLIRNTKKAGHFAVDVNSILEYAKHHYDVIKNNHQVFGWINGGSVCLSANPPSYTRCVRFVYGIPIYSG